MALANTPALDNVFLPSDFTQVLGVFEIYRLNALYTRNIAQI